MIWLIKIEQKNGDGDGRSWDADKIEIFTVIKDTFDFVNKISRLDIEPGDQIVSFDVESLFTNVPVDETTEDILDLAFKSKHVINDTFHGLKRESLKQLLILSTKNHISNLTENFMIKSTE